MNEIYNFTMHKATPEQLAEGVVDLEEKDRETLINLLTFEELPSNYELDARAGQIAIQAKLLGAKKVMIGGVPFFMSYLEEALRQYDVEFVYAFSKREVIESQQLDGTVIKKSVFKHEGFIG